VIILLLIVACRQNDGEIKTLLQSKDFQDRIEGAYKAGEAGKVEFTPYLLKNADDPATSSDWRFLGVSVYQEKMIALKKILKTEPPVKITRNPDSAVIRFYTVAASKYLNK